MLLAFSFSYIGSKRIMTTPSGRLLTWSCEDGRLGRFKTTIGDVLFTRGIYSLEPPITLLSLIVDPSGGRILGTSIDTKLVGEIGKGGCSAWKAGFLFNQSIENLNAWPK